MRFCFERSGRKFCGRSFEEFALLSPTHCSIHDYFSETVRVCSLVPFVSCDFIVTLYFATVETS
ncbi:hypothetical protein CSUI_001541 [Cystoisospora suis]|uniref:Uncharacterized protein n=1 Tax=Cystoisospora suis TaxID=483139 RepID=A0A2C6KX50_9APIC|nr:hypothetical protein CSUI_001541 [Cystoisospora suis]